MRDYLDQQARRESQRNRANEDAATLAVIALSFLTGLLCLTLTLIA